MNRGWLLAHGLVEVPAIEGEEVTALLPQRAPLLLVDRIVAVAAPGRPRPALAAVLDIRGDEPVLAGHFPGQSVWPGSYTIEGLAQTCALAGAWATAATAAAATATAATATAATAAAATAAADRRSAPPIVVVAAVKVKLTGLITPPARLVYFAEQIGQVGGVYRFAVEASVAERAVAKGALDVTIPVGAS